MGEGLFIKSRIFTNKVTSSSGGVITVSTVTGDGLLATIPAGYVLEFILGIETGGVAIDLRFGTSAGGSQIDPGTTFNASQATTIQLNYITTAMLTNPQAIYVSDTGAGWGASSMNFTIFLRKAV